MPCKLKASVENSFSKHPHKLDASIRKRNAVQKTCSFFLVEADKDNTKAPKNWHKALMLIQHLLLIEAQTNI